MFDDDIQKDRELDFFVSIYRCETCGNRMVYRDMIAQTTDCTSCKSTARKTHQKSGQTFYEEANIKCTRQLTENEQKRYEKAIAGVRENVNYEKLRKEMEKLCGKAME